MRHLKKVHINIGADGPDVLWHKGRVTHGRAFGGPYGQVSSFDFIRVSSFLHCPKFSSYKFPVHFFIIPKFSSNGF